MSAINDIYGFEYALESALVSALASDGLTIYSESNDALLEAHPELSESGTSFFIPSTLEFQKIRPRVEMAVSIGAAKGVYHYSGADAMPVGGSMRETSYAAGIAFQVVSDSIGPQLRSMVCQLRCSMDTIRERINESPYLPYHSVHSITHENSSNIFSPEEGLFVTSLQYNIEFCIRTDAWDLLTNNTNQG